MRPLGTAITGRNSPKRYLKPDAFSTIYSDPPEEPGMFRRRPPRNSEVFLLEGANPDEFKQHAIPGVTYGAKCGGRMFRANSGYSFSGFLVCRPLRQVVRVPPNGTASRGPLGRQLRRHTHQPPPCSRTRDRRSPTPLQRLYTPRPKTSGSALLALIRGQFPPWLHRRPRHRAKRPRRNLQRLDRW